MLCLLRSNSKPLLRVYLFNLFWFRTWTLYYWFFVAIPFICFSNVSKFVGMKTSKSSGNQYNTIDSALAIPPGVNAPDQITESCEINFENIHEHWEKIPRFIVDKIKLVPEYANIDFEFPDFDEMDHDVDDTPTTLSTPKQTSPRQPIVPETPKMPF